MKMRKFEFIVETRDGKTIRIRVEAVDTFSANAQVKSMYQGAKQIMFDREVFG